MTLRLLLLAVLPAGLLGIAAAAAVWLPGADNLSLTRLLVGGAVLIVVQAAVGGALGYVLGRRGVLR